VVNTPMLTGSDIWPVIYISKYNEIRSLYPQHILIFTDGSKLSNHTATAVVFKSDIITKRLPNSFLYTLLNCMPYF